LSEFNVASSSFQTVTNLCPALPAPATMDVRIDAQVSVEALALSCSSANSELSTPSTNVPAALPTSFVVGTTSAMNALPTPQRQMLALRAG
jgi:hypothetical protein